MDPYSFVRCRRGRPPARARKRWLPFVAAVLPFAAGALDAQVEALDPQFQANSYTTDDQRRAKVAAAPDGGFVVVWESDGSAGDDDDFTSIQARAFDPAGTPLADDLQINVQTASFQRSPEIAGRPDGTFVVVWSSQSQPRGRVLDAAGVPVGGEFAFPTGGGEPTVAVAADGSFVTVWQTVSPSDIEAQRYTADATPIGPSFIVNTIGGVDHFSPRVSAASDGRFVVAWNSSASNGDDEDSSVQARRFLADGTPLGDQFQVNTYTTSYQSFARIAFGDSGRFIIVWDSDGSAGSDSSLRSVQARLYNPDGTPLGSEFQVNTTTAGSQSRAHVTALPGDQFLVAWHGGGIHGQVVTDEGDFVGAELQISTAAGVNYPVGLSNTPDDLFVVSWGGTVSTGDDGSGYSAQARRYRALALFADGFESGDSSAWSTTVP